MGAKTASKSVMYYPILMLILVVMITVTALTLGMNVRTEFNNKDFLPNDWESLETQSELEESFNGSSFVQAYVLLESEGSGDLATVSALEGIEEITDNIKNDKYVVKVNGVPRVDSVLSFVETAIRSNF